MKKFSFWMGVVAPLFLSGHLSAALAAEWLRGVEPSPHTAQNYAQFVLTSGDHKGLPFAIVDKMASLILVYQADGTLAGTSTVLLGQTKGDAIVPGTGERTQARRLRPADRTTPAGRFVSEPGHNEAGEAVVWVDYDAAFAIHRLRPSPLRERRAQRMASSNAQDKRISAGCVVVPVAFYLRVIQPVLGHSKGMVYVTTEDGRLPS